MDDVVCQGDEKALSHCIFTGWGSSDCEPDEAAGAICFNKTDIEVVTERSHKGIHEVLDIKTASLRLVGGRSNNEGRVEVM
jgi:hypothetical protein